MKRINLPDGHTVPVLGLGTWKMGEQRALRATEVAAVRYGLDRGMTVVDTAEMYADGGAEIVVGEAIAGRREDAFVVTKVYPHNAGKVSAVAACERSLKRLRIDCIDLYLLHWRGSIPLAETVDAFERMRNAGKIARWGVSNFDVADMHELLALPDGRNCATNQVLYNLSERGIEWELATLCRAHAIPLMAYSPVGQGVLLRSRRLAALAATYNVTPAALALAWVMAQPGVIAIPKATTLAHLDENHRACQLELDATARAAIDAAFPPPARATPLAML